MSKKSEATIHGRSALLGVAAGVSAFSVLLWVKRRVIQKRSEKAVARRLFSSDPLLALYGSGKTLWADEHGDNYVARLREG